LSYGHLARSTAVSGWNPARRHRQDACVTGFMLFRFVLEDDFAQEANGWHAVIEQQ
jgi:hypothetical protein